MSSSVVLERTGTTTPTGYHPGVSQHTPGTSTGVPVGNANYLMVPRCTYKVEKCTGGLRIHCCCDDKTACSMVQNLCTMLAGGLCSCCVTCNGLTICTYNLTLGHCKCEVTENGCCITCTSGDAKCCEMLQSFCDCLCSMLDAGCTCYIQQNQTPVCCGTSQTHSCSTHSQQQQVSKQQPQQQQPAKTK